MVERWKEHATTQGGSGPAHPTPPPLPLPRARARAAGTAPAAAGLAAVALAGTPARLRALQAALWGGRPGLADPIMTALGTAPQHGGAPELQLVCSVVLRLEGIATAGGSAAGGDVHSGGGSADGGGKGRGAGAGAAAARWSAAGGRAGSGGGGADGDGAAASVEAAAPDAAVAGAAELTRWQVAGELPEYQAAAAAAAWRALRELCWCPEPPARGAAARWLQQLLAAALEHASEVRAQPRLRMHAQRMSGTCTLAGRVLHPPPPLLPEHRSQRALPRPPGFPRARTPSRSRPAPTPPRRRSRTQTPGWARSQRRSRTSWATAPRGQTSY